MYKVLLYIFLFYLAYQFIFHFLFPVYKTTQQVKKGFREMHERMNASANEQSYPPSSPSQPKASAETRSSEDYIDFEEVK